MQLPKQLQLAIEKMMQHCGLNHLMTAREDLSERYRQGTREHALMDNEAHRTSYALTRMPATFAAIMKVFAAMKKLAPDLKIEHLLDMGAGPGTASWAAVESFSELQSSTLIERDASLIEMGKKFIQNTDFAHSCAANWHIADLTQPLDIEPKDLVIFSYSIGELPTVIVPSLLDQAWKLAKKALIIVEPGTPIGFKRILAIRSHLLQLGAYLLAPCPHHESCPLSESDWCHFSARVERTAYHRLLKSGTLNYEDEKFSYLVFTKEKYPLPASRILRHPLQRSGHTLLTLCTPKGIENRTISKRTKEAYKEAKKADWGDTFSFHD